jgi:Fe-S cluster assembly ATP-binding protein
MVMGETEMLRAEHVSLVRDGRSILSDLSLSITAGTVHSILGSNAAGKSSLAAALMGCSDYALTSGSVYFLGKDITRLPIHERAKMGLTLAWQDPARFEGLTVRDYLTVGVGANSANSADRVEEALQKVLLSPKEYLQRPVDKTLSGGERKRIELAAVFAMRPRLAILDEPDSGIDILALDHIVEMIRELKKRGTTVLLITHREEVAELADMSSLICSGLIVKEGKPPDVGRYFKEKCIPCPTRVFEAEERHQSEESRTDAGL